jgi:FkbM family methyltransferase
MGLRRSLKNILGYEAADPYLSQSYSQEGEDMVLYRTFETVQNGFYVDVGAHHPKRFSNTYKFYKLGWRGINIDAMPGSMEPFNKLRPRDINLEIPVSDKEEVLPFHIFNEPALNTFSKELADERSVKPEYRVEKVVDIKTRTLADILKAHLPQSQKINYLSIDAEGFDYQILRSNNWQLYRPELVLVELESDFGNFQQSDVYRFMKQQGYAFYAKTVKTYFFKNIQ